MGTFIDPDTGQEFMVDLPSSPTDLGELPLDTLVTSNVDRKIYPGSDSGDWREVLNEEQRIKYNQGVDYINKLIVNPITKGAYGYETAEDFIQKGYAPKAIQKHFGAKMRNFQALNHIINDFYYDDEQVGAFLEDYYNDFMAGVVVQTYGGGASAYSISDEHSDMAMLGKIEELDKLQNKFTTLMNTPNSEGNLVKEVRDSETGVVTQIGESKYHDMIMHNKKVSAQNDIYKDAYEEAYQEYTDILSVFDTNTNFDNFLGDWFGLAPGNTFSGMWYDDRMTGHDMVKGITHDVASVIMSPLHIVDIFWPGDLYDSDMHQYNPLTGGFGPDKQLKAAEKKMLDAENQYKEYQADNYEAIFGSGKSLIEDAQKYQNLRMEVEQSGYDELLQFMDAEEVKRLLEQKRTVK